MGRWRTFDSCKNCKNNKTFGWRFGIRKEGGCLFPDDSEYGVTTDTTNCPGFEYKDK